MNLHEFIQHFVSFVETTDGLEFLKRVVDEKRAMTAEAAVKRLQEKEDDNKWSEDGIGSMDPITRNLNLANDGESSLLTQRAINAWKTLRHDSRRKASSKRQKKQSQVR
jgi:hypothetical protein